MRDSRDGAPEPGGATLTAEERGRIRSTVDVAALEQFLRTAPDLPRGARRTFRD